jgi:hypothetical protein
VASAVFTYTSKKWRAPAARARLRSSRYGEMNAVMQIAPASANSAATSPRAGYSPDGQPARSPGPHSGHVACYRRRACRHASPGRITGAPSAIASVDVRAAQPVWPDNGAGMPARADRLAVLAHRDDGVIDLGQFVLRKGDAELLAASGDGMAPE